MTISDHPPLAPGRTHRTRVAPASPDRLDLLQPLASPSDAGGGAFASYGRGGSPAADDGVRPASVTAAVDGTSVCDSYSLIVAIRRHVNRSSVAIAYGAALVRRW
jgi:S1-C subfamily serine protease